MRRPLAPSFRRSLPQAPLDAELVPGGCQSTLQAVQVMMGLINGALGRIWLLFYTRQFGEISTEYKPVALLSGYPSWTFLFFIISGVLTIETEKKRSPNLMTPTLAAPSGVLAVLTLITEASAVPTHGAPLSATIEHGALSLPGVSSVPRALLGPVGPHSTPLLGFSCKNPGKLASGRQDSTPDNADLSFLSVWAPCRKDGSSGGQPLMVLGERLL
ncbi:hypothetical protein MG293_012050 [Ovis ammon polii]|uniref:Uncharacterized protein n=1 Tax=Ovis ammon polii TaxID=230172 RepID=A0AAD4U2M4_OVIAM|nr:hypothetical protein MG293_012050 [Ovis ammon polii]